LIRFDWRNDAGDRFQKKNVQPSPQKWLVRVGRKCQKTNDHSTCHVTVEGRAVFRRVRGIAPIIFRPSLSVALAALSDQKNKIILDFLNRTCDYSPALKKPRRTDAINIRTALTKSL